MADPFVKMMRNKKTGELIKDKNTMHLLTCIAYRAQRTSDFNIDGLKSGQALIGDYVNLDLSRQEYRTALKKLRKWNLVTIKATSRGTIATLCDDSVFDINQETVQPSKQPSANHQATIEQPSANHQATTNKKKRIKEEKNERNQSRASSGQFFESFWNAYPVKKDKKSCLKKWQQRKLDDLYQDIMAGLRNLMENDDNWRTGQFIPNPSTFLNGDRWNDEAKRKSNNNPLFSEADQARMELRNGNYEIN